jgi:putative Mn2+ efflux pump MntP
LILCLNIDALSYGIAYGLKKIRLKTTYVLLISLLSSVMFFIPLYFSKFISNFLSKNILNFVNGLILIFLGIKYIFSKDKKNTSNEISFSFKQCFFECLAFSTDAIFTALLGSFSYNFFLICIIFYEFSNFLAIFCGNLIFYHINKNISINLNIFSGFIFIFLGIFKMIGF